MHRAVLIGDVSIVKMLLAKGADAGAQNEYGETALMLAQKYDETEIDPTIVALLKKTGIN